MTAPRNLLPIDVVLRAVDSHVFDAYEHLCRAHPTKRVYTKIAELIDRGYLDCGVSSVRPWLTQQGKNYLAGSKPTTTHRVAMLTCGRKCDAPELNVDFATKEVFCACGWRASTNREPVPRNADGLSPGVCVDCKKKVDNRFANGQCGMCGV